MKARALASILAIAGLATATTSSQAEPAPTSFSYQASLADNGSPVNGPTLMEFNLWDAASGGTQVGPTIASEPTVEDGVFSVDLDFGAASFAVNQALWLEVIVDGQSMGRTPLGASPLALNVRGITIAENGFVGIGTDAPTQMLEVSPRIKTSSLITDGLTALAARFVSSGADFEIRAGDNGTQFINKDTDEVAMFMDPDTGFFGIGTQSPSQRLEVEGRIKTGSLIANVLTCIAVRYIDSGSDFEINPNGDGLRFINKDTNTNVMLFDKDTNFVGIGTNSPSTALDIDGAVTIRGGADIVEGFDSACGTAFEPGTLLVIDPENPGKLMCSSDAYDMKVAGVVSGAGGVNPGLKLGQEGVMDGEISVSMTGRVYVKASAENGAIQPGDLLTTSTLLGHAMKATDRDRSGGAVVGKAMSSLDADTGLVLVLVNLQ
ncbi:MAG: hypothetical protein AB8F26_08340 [Phycisphaerales bacterium]